MKMPEVRLKRWWGIVLLALLCIHPALAQDKYFKITDDGKYYFFNEATIEQNNIVNGNNTYTRPITSRTFYFEARKVNLFPEAFPFSDFQKLTISEQQKLLDSLQQAFDWSKYRVSQSGKEDTVKTPLRAKVDPVADTIYTVQNLGFDKESSTVIGELVSGNGRKQQFMMYPATQRVSNEDVLWIIEWVESTLYLKKKGYGNLKLPESKVYLSLLEIGVDLKVLNGLLE